MFIEQWSTNHNYSLSKEIFNPTVLISEDTHFTLAEGKKQGVRRRFFSFSIYHFAPKSVFMSAFIFVIEEREFNRIKRHFLTITRSVYFVSRLKLP